MGIHIAALTDELKMFAIAKDPNYWYMISVLVIHPGIGCIMSIHNQS